MLLEPQDVELFFRLHRTLMFFVNQRLKVIPNQLGTSEEFAALSPDFRVKVRDALSANVDLIQAFVDETPSHFSEGELDIRRPGVVATIRGLFRAVPAGHDADSPAALQCRSTDS